MELLFLLILILLMAIALGSGFPVAFSLPGSAILSISLAALCGWLFEGDTSAYFLHGGPSDWLSAGVTNFRGVYWEAERDTLIAIPLFIFMGIMLQRSRIAEDLLVTMAQLFGPVRGGLGISVVFVGGLLAATTGIVGATVVAMGLISLPAMLRSNYSHPVATGTIAASGTLGQIIPPSIVLIILADQLTSATDQASSARKALHKAATGELSMPSEFGVSSTSAGEMFLGAFLPGVLLVGIYIVFIAILALVRPKAAPAVPYEGKYDLRFAGRVAFVLIPPLALIFLVLGSIILGIATVNQAGAIGAVGALIMGGYKLKEGQPRAYWPAILAVISVAVIMFCIQSHPINVKRLTTQEDVYWMLTALIATAFFIVAMAWSGWRAFKIDNTLQNVMVETAKTTSLVFIILIGAAMLTAAFRAFGGEDLVRDFLTRMPGGFWGQFFIVMAVIFVMGFFLDFIEIAVVVVPIVAPILLMDPGANVTAVWLGVMIGLNIQTSFLTPPFGFALFYLRGVAPKIVKTISMYKGVIPFICLQLLALVVVALNPPLVNYLPQRIALTSETAPPPVNPRLQACIEEDLFRRYRNEESEIMSAIGKARGIDLSTLPAKMRKDLEESFDLAAKTFPLVEEARQAEAAIDTAAPGYRPLHESVRYTQSEILRARNRIAILRRDIGRLGNDPRFQDRKQRLERQAAELDAEVKRLEATIPAEWKQRHEDFSKLLKAGKTARLKYRRNVDNAYEPVRETVNALKAADELEKLRPDLKALRSVIEKYAPEEAAPSVESLMDRAGDVSRELRSTLYKVRRELTGRNADKRKALAALGEAEQMFARELAWRQTARDAILPQLSVYEEAIRDTIGLRQQPRLPEDEALDVATCMSYHRDLSLYF